MPDIHLRTFLGNCCRDSALNVQRYAKYSEPSSKGHNYHWSLEKTVREMVIGGAPFDMAVGHINKIQKDDERQNNQEGARAFNRWWVDHKADGFEVPSALLSAPKGELRVLIRPDFGLIRGKKRECVLLWNSKTPPLPRRMAGLGVFAMQKTLVPMGFEQCDFVVHDLRAEQRHLSGAIPNNAASILQIELMRQEEAFLAGHLAP